MPLTMGSQEVQDPPETSKKNKKKEATNKPPYDGSKLKGDGSTPPSGRL